MGHNDSSCTWNEWEKKVMIHTVSRLVWVFLVSHWVLIITVDVINNFYGKPLSPACAFSFVSLTRSFCVSTT